MNNMISHSVLHWDFGRYVVDRNLGHFHSVPFTFDEEYNIEQYLLDSECAECGTLITAPTPLDKENV
jgi:hypothetical protein